MELKSPSEFYRSGTQGLAWGLRPRPPRRLTHAGARPRGHLPSDHAMRRDSHDHPLLAFPSPSGFHPLDPTRTSRCTPPLLGFLPLQRLRGAESTSLAPAGPIPPATFRPQGSRPLDGFLLHPPVPRLSAEKRSCGSPSRGFPPRTGPEARRSRVPLLAFLPRPGLSSPRTKRTAGASATFLGSPSLTPFTAYRVLLCPRVRAVRANRLSPLVGRSPPGLSPP